MQCYATIENCMVLEQFQQMMISKQTDNLVPACGSFGGDIFLRRFCVVDRTPEILCDLEKRQ